MTCQPIYAGVRQGTHPKNPAQPVTEHQPRCACGWRGEWVHLWPVVYDQLAGHLRRERRPV